MTRSEFLLLKANPHAAVVDPGGKPLGRTKDAKKVTGDRPINPKQGAGVKVYR